MSKLKEIIEGHVNEFKSLISVTSEDHRKIFKSREKICLQCPLKSGNTCNTRMSINPETLETAPAAENKPGFVKGCGCRLSAKQKSLTSKCPAGFWGEENK